jgi:predicted secreted Zn-dependent protease
MQSIAKYCNNIATNISKQKVLQNNSIAKVLQGVLQSMPKKDCKVLQSSIAHVNQKNQCIAKVLQSIAKKKYCEVLQSIAKKVLRSIAK